MTRPLVAALAVSLASCTHPTSVAPSDPPSAWHATIEATRQAVATGHYAEADSILRAYAAAHPGTADAHETAYWRGVLKLDPANRGGTSRGAVEELDAYLADSADTTHRTEALVLRRLATSVDSLSRLHDAVSSTPPPTSADADAAAQRADSLQKEVNRLREQLDKTNAELERIKKRLSEGAQKP
ncbi:MAG TPA: hypothetical protein VEI06_09745 [Gemmatimonadaceae bacterium]|nr:hypothetical protein [Gemmatimonadaceae bacterium]